MVGTPGGQRQGDLDKFGVSQGYIVRLWLKTIKKLGGSVTLTFDLRMKCLVSWVTGIGFLTFPCLRRPVSTEVFNVPVPLPP